RQGAAGLGKPRVRAPAPQSATSGVRRRSGLNRAGAHMPGQPAETANLPPVWHSGTIADGPKGQTEVTAVTLSARERRTLSCIADELADSAPELASFLSVFNRLTSGEELPQHRHASDTEKCDRQRSRRSRRHTWTRRKASPGRQRVRLATA